MEENNSNIEQLTEYDSNGTEVQLTDFLKSPIYPFTKESAVYDENGNPLTEKLQFDNEPVEDSNKAITSGAVYNSLVANVYYIEI